MGRAIPAVLYGCIVVMGMCIAISSPPSAFSFGSTRFWVVFVEVMPSMILFMGNVLGVNFGPSSLPGPMHRVLQPLFTFSALLTTVLVARLRGTNSKALRCGEYPPLDTLAGSWTQRIILPSFLFVDFILCWSQDNKSSANAWLSPNISVTFWIFVPLLQIICAMYFIWSCWNYY